MIYTTPHVRAHAANALREGRGGPDGYGTRLADATRHDDRCPGPRPRAMLCSHYLYCVSSRPRALLLVGPRSPPNAAIAAPSLAWASAPRPPSSELAGTVPSVGAAASLRGLGEPMRLGGCGAGWKAPFASSSSSVERRRVQKLGREGLLERELAGELGDGRVVVRLEHGEPPRGRVDRGGRVDVGAALGGRQAPTVAIAAPPSTARARRPRGSQTWCRCAGRRRGGATRRRGARSRSRAVRSTRGRGAGARSTRRAARGATRGRACTGARRSRARSPASTAG